MPSAPTCRAAWFSDWPMATLAAAQAPTGPEPVLSPAAGSLDGGGDRRVERCDPSPHRQPDQLVAGVAGQAGEAAPLSLIEDYDPAQDRIAVVMDEPEDAAPEISVAPSQ